MSKEEVVFPAPRVLLQRQHHLARSPRVGKVEEVPPVLITLFSLQVCLPPIQSATSHLLLEQDIREFSQVKIFYSFDLPPSHFMTVW